MLLCPAESATPSLFRIKKRIKKAPRCVPAIAEKLSKTVPVRQSVTATKQPVAVNNS